MNEYHLCSRIVNLLNMYLKATQAFISHLYLTYHSQIKKFTLHDFFLENYTCTIIRTELKILFFLLLIVRNNNIIFEPWSYNWDAHAMRKCFNQNGLNRHYETSFLFVVLIRPTGYTLEIGSRSSRRQFQSKKIQFRKVKLSIMLTMSLQPSIG